MVRTAILPGLLAAALAPTFAFAQEPRKDILGKQLEVVGKFEIAKVRGRRYRELSQPVERYPQLLRIAPPNGCVFGVVELTLQYEKDTTRDKAQIPVELFTLAVGDETFESIGSLDRTTAFSYSGVDLLGSDKKETTFFEAVFVLPERARKATLRIGDEIHEGEDYRTEVEFDSEVGRRPDPSERFEIEVLSAVRSEGIRDRESFSSGDERVELRYLLRTSQEIVTVEFELTANVATASNHFMAAPWDFQIDVGDGRLIPALGKHDEKVQFESLKLSEDFLSMIKSRVLEDGTFEPTRHALAFELPKGADRGKLLFYGEPVAEFVVK